MCSMVQGDGVWAEEIEIGRSPAGEVRENIQV